MLRTMFPVFTSFGLNDLYQMRLILIWSYNSRAYKSVAKYSVVS